MFFSKKKKKNVFSCLVRKLKKGILSIKCFRKIGNVCYVPSVSVKDMAMLRYIRDRTAAPYFSNLVWFIGSHILDLDICVRNDAE